MRKILVVVFGLFCLCGCSKAEPVPAAYDALQSACVSVENQTGCTIELLTINGGEDLLPYGSLAPGAAVRLEFVPQPDALYTLEVLLQNGDWIEFPPTRIQPGAELCLQLQSDALAS